MTGEKTVVRWIMENLSLLHPQNSRAVFNTHMHDLSRNLDKVNSEVDGDSKIESKVTGVENGNRSYKVFIAPPQRVSYARDIAEKYGVIFEKIKSEIDNKSGN